MKKIVLTGASGALGSRLREPLSRMADTLLSTDMTEPPETLFDGETYVKADLGQMDQVMPLLDGADMVVHFGAIADEAPFADIMHSNIMGAYNIWEAAYQAGAKRVVYASSIHAVGMHKKTDFIGTDAPLRPDTFYGLAKCFGENLGSLYWDKRGLESVCLRILSCTTVGNARALGSWLSYDDLIHLVEQSINTPVTGHTIIYGVSANDRAPVDNTKASFLGYRPKDNAEQFAPDILAQADPADPQDPAQMCQGGPFAIVELGKSGVSLIKASK